MAKNLIEFSSYDADTTSYASYSSTKTVLGPSIYKFSGLTPSEAYISPNETTFEDITQDAGVSNWGDIAAITYNQNTQWLFCLKGAVATNTTTDIAMYQFNKTTFTYSFVGAVTVTGADTTSVNRQGFSADLSYYTTGTVEVNGLTVSGTGSNWIESRIPIGSRIGFGSTNSADITTWYRISDYPLMVTSLSRVNSTVVCTKAGPSGSVYIGGDFTTYNGLTASRIARLNSDGSLDTSFNTGAGFNSTVQVIEIDSSGKVFVGGSFTTYQGITASRIIKLNIDGTKDATFNNNNTFNSDVYAIAFDSLGKIWTGGIFTSYLGLTAAYLTKLNTDGTRDVSYPNTQNPNNYVITIAPDNNNDVYIGGIFTQIGATAGNANRIAKILKTGGLDSTFVVGAGGGFNSQVSSIHYKSSSNSVIVAGAFTTYKAVGNSNLTEISSLGNAIISSASPVAISSIKADTIGNIYCSGGSQIITKRNINTLLTDQNFTPNIVYTAASFTKIIDVNSTNDRLFAVSGNLTIDSGIVCVDTTYGARVPGFLTSQDYKSQVIRLTTSAGILPAGTPYVIEDLRFSLQIGSLGTYLLQGLTINDFTVTPTAITLPALNFAGLSKGIYSIYDGSYATSNGFQTGNNVGPSGKDTHFATKQSDNLQYLYVALANGRIIRYNIRSPYLNQLGLNAQGRIRFSTADQILVTSTGVTSPNNAAVSGFASGKLAVATMQSGSAAGQESIYLDSTGIIQTPTSQLVNEATVTYTIMAETPPGSVTTYAAAGNVGRVYFIPQIDRLLVLNVSSTAKSYITKYLTNIIQPTLSGTLYGRDTYNKLAVDNSYDLAFLVNGNQLQGNTSNTNAPKYPDTLGTGFFGTVEGGVLHLCRPLNTIQNNLYSLPIDCDAEYVSFSNNVFITPKYNLTRAISITGLYVNTLKQYGSFPFGIAPEPIIIHYRTTGIDDNTGTWISYSTINELNNEISCDGVIENLAIQFRFSFKVAGNTCLVNKIYGFSILWEDDRTDSHYSPSVSKSSLTSRIFAWRQEELWYGNIPDLKIRRYNASNSNIVFYDTVTTSASGTWEYSTDGTTWLSWSSSADAIGNYIRYVADWVPAGIKLRVGLNRI
jgi:hypothetical protein